MELIRKGEFLYKQNEPSDNIYILVEGEFETFVVDDSSVEYPVRQITEPNTLIGVTAAILQIPRVTSVRAIKDSLVNVIVAKKDALIKTILTTPKFGFTLAISLAQNQREINQRITNLSVMLKSVKQKTDHLCKTYYELSETIERKFQQYKFPWLNELYKSAKDSLIYNIGKSVSVGKEYIQTIVKKKDLLSILKEDTTLSKENSREYKKGKLLCVEGDLGNEMYILLSGKLNVIVGNELVATISDKSAVIGEIAVLLGYKSKKWEPRTATIEVVEDSKVIVIDGTNIKDILLNDAKLTLHLCKTIASRLPNTFMKFLELDIKLKKLLSLLNYSNVTSSNIPRSFKNMNENIILKSAGNEILNDVAEISRDKLSESIKLYEKSRQEYSVISGYDINAANKKIEELKTIENKTKEKEDTNQPPPKSELSTSENQISEQEQEQQRREVYEKITKQLNLDKLIKKNP